MDVLYLYIHLHIHKITIFNPPSQKCCRILHLAIALSSNVGYLCIFKREIAEVLRSKSFLVKKLVQRLGCCNLDSGVVLNGVLRDLESADVIIWII